MEIAARALPALDYVLVDLGKERKEREASKGLREKLMALGREKTARERNAGDGDGGEETR